MKSYALFQEYIWLVNTIHKAERITLEEINRRWLDTEMSEGVSIARSTFNRHRDAILHIFVIIIECYKKDGFRYYIYNTDVLEEDSIQNWMLSTMSVNSILAENKGIHDRIVLESIPSDGESLHKFIDAMKLSVRIKVVYRTYGDEEKTEMTVDPYFVKLINKRWYGIVKKPIEDGWMFVLAFDRILELELTEEKFKYPKGFDPAAFFRDNYGIVWNDSIPIEKVIIRAYGKQVYYFRDLPLHHTQREIATEDNYSDFEMHLRVTSDFYTPLLSRGPLIKVLEPQYLAAEIRKQHEAAAFLYIEKDEEEKT